MYKTVTAITFVLVSVFATFSQGNGTSTLALFDVYAGMPGLDNAGLEARYQLSFLSTDITKSKSSLHYGVRGEYLVAPRLGVGLDIRYISSYIEGNYQSFMSGDSTTYQVRIDKQRIGFMPSLMCHFLDNERIDLYFHLGMGYKIKTIRETSNEPGYQARFTEEDALPLAFRLGLGLRAYVTDQIGVQFNFGGGQGGIFQFGATYRL